MNHASAEANVSQELIELETLVALECSSNSPPGAAPPTKLTGIVIGEVVGWDAKNQPLVQYPGNPFDSAVPALSTVRITAERPSRVALGFEQGDASRPIILGVLEYPANATQPEQHSPASHRAINVQVDDDRLVLSAEREIVLRCGSASITLTKAGKVLIRGAYLSSRSSGVNRIKGGAVHIN